MSHFFFSGRKPAATDISPGDLSGLTVWCKADGELTKDVSDNVSAWGETGGSLIQVTQGTGSRQPTWLADGGDGLNSVRFDGVDDILASAPTSLPAEFSVFLVVRYGVEAARTPWSHFAASTNRAFFDRYSGNVQYAVTRNGVNSAYNIAESGTSKRMIRHEINGSHATHKYFLNGVEQSAVSTSSGNPSGSLSTPIRVGGYDFSSLFFNGDIMEFILYDEFRSSGESEDVESYLTTRWGPF